MTAEKYHFMKRAIALSRRRATIKSNGAIELVIVKK